jgi:hypothetical protein
MESRDHLKNGATPKSQTSRKINKGKIMKKIFFATIAFPMAMFFSSCEKTDEPDPLTIAEFLGNYSIGEGSYSAPLDSNNQPILTERTDIAGEVLTVTQGTGDTLILSSPTLGSIKVIPAISGERVNLNMPDQPYNGSLDITGGGATLSTTENFHFRKEKDNKKFFDSNSGNGNITMTMRAGNKYQVSIRRTGVS